MEKIVQIQFRKDSKNNFNVSLFKQSGKVIYKTINKNKLIKYLLTNPKKNESMV